MAAIDDSVLKKQREHVCVCVLCVVFVSSVLFALSGFL